MGRKRTGERQYILFCIAGIILISLSACNALKGVGKDANNKAGHRKEVYKHLLAANELVENGNLEDAIKENQLVLSMSNNTPPADEALFNMGLIYVHHGNNRKDYKASLEMFKRLEKDYPQSPLVEQAKTWVSTLETIDKLTKRADEKRSVNESLFRANKLLSQGDYEGALREYNKVLAITGKNAPADEALFNSGLIYADYRNPKKDIKKALGFFERVMKDYPQSLLVQESEIWIGVLRVIEKSKQVDIEIEEMKKEMSR
ncbi:MAG: tetratricopeptide repeat protein [Nitrospirota bacterium]